MRFATKCKLLVIGLTGVEAFVAPSPPSLKTHLDHWSTQIYSSAEVLVELQSESAPTEIIAVQDEKEDQVGPVTAELINSRLEKQLAKMRLKDQTSKQLTKEVCYTVFFRSTVVSAFLFTVSSLYYILLFFANETKLGFGYHSRGCKYFGP